MNVYYSLLTQWQNKTLKINTAAARAACANREQNVNAALDEGKDLKPPEIISRYITH